MDLELDNEEKKKKIYIARKLLNPHEVIEWAKNAGFNFCLEPKDFHITVIYSRNHVYFSDYSPHQDILICTNTKHRHLKLLGTCAVVLTFRDDDLMERNDALVASGIEMSYPVYMPHLTISYRDYDQPKHIMELEPYMGELIFGPEYIEDVDHDNEFNEIDLKMYPYV